MSKSSTATAPKPPPLATQKSAWSKGPPSAPSPRSSSPAPITPTHSRRPSNLSQAAVAIGGSALPKSNLSSATAVTFGSIDNVSSSVPTASASSAPQTSTTAAATKSEVKSFGTVPASTAATVNGKVNAPSKSSSLASSSSSTSASTSTTVTASSTATSTPTSSSASLTKEKLDIRNLFRGTPSSQPTPEVSSSPGPRTSNLPPQQQPHHPPYQPQGPNVAGGSPSSFQYPSGGNQRPPQQNNSGPSGSVNGGGGPPRSPANMRNANGNPSRHQNGPNVNGPNANHAGLSSPRISQHHPVQQPPPPSQMPPPMQWQGYYQGYPDQYYPPQQQWGYVASPLNNTMHLHPQQHSMSPRSAPMALQQQPVPGVPGTPTQTHAVAVPHPPPPGPHGLHHPQMVGIPPNSQHLPHHQHPPPPPNQQLSNQQQPPQSGPHGLHHQQQPPPVHTLNSGAALFSPPPTPSSTTNPRLNVNVNEFVPGSRPVSKVTIKNDKGVEVKLPAAPQSAVDGRNSAIPSPVTGSTGWTVPKSRPISMRRESEEEKRERERKEKEEREKRVREERERVEKAEREEKERKEKEKKEEEERIRKEEEEKEKIKKAEEEKLEQERKRKEEEERVKREEEARLKREEEEKERLRLEEVAKQLKLEEEARAQEQKRKEEEEEARAKAQAEEEAATAAAAEAAASTSAKEAAASESPPEDEDEDEEEGEIIESTTLPPPPMAPKEETKERVKESLRIVTNKPRPGALDLSLTKGPMSASLPSALATARVIENINTVSYPEGIMSPRPDLNTNAKDGKFRYDRDFLLQFMKICKEKPDHLPPLDAIGLDISSVPEYPAHTMSRGGSGRQRTASSNIGGGSSRSGLAITNSHGFNKPSSSAFGGPIGSFATPNASKLSSEDRFSLSSAGGTAANGGSGNRAASISTMPSMMQGRGFPMQRTASQGPTGSGGPPAVPSNRTRSKRGEKRPEGGKAPMSGSGGQSSSSAFGHHGPSGMQNSSMMGLEPVAPLKATENRWDRKVVSNVDPNSPEVVERKVKGLLNKLTMEKFDSISDQIIAWANKSEEEKDGRTLIQVIKLVFEKATDEATWSEMYARLCRKMMEQISPKVQDDGIKNAEGKPITGGQLFRKYLLNRCQEDFERGWVAKEATAAAAATKAMEDQAAKAANDKNKEGETGDEIVLYSEEYYAAQKAKRQGLGLIKFIGELFKLQMLTERIMHECVKKLLGNVENPEEEEIESLCKLLSTVGQLLDTQKARAHMDVYFSRMKELVKSGNVTSRMQFMLQDVIELRQRGWVTRNTVAAPATLAQIHENAAKEKADKEKEASQRHISMSRGGSRRGGERSDFPQPGPDGWTAAPSGPPRPPPKAGDLSNFGKISKAMPMTFGPTSVFSGKDKAGNPKRDSLSRSSSSSNMFSMLQNNEAAAEAMAAAGVAKGSRPHSRKTSVDLTQIGGAAEPAQRKRLVLQPRTKPTAEEGASPAPGPSAELENDNDAEAEGGEEQGDVPEMSEAEADKKIAEDSKEFFAVRNLEEAEVYFTNLTAKFHNRLVNKVASAAVESKASDAQLVADLFARAVEKQLCSPAEFEAGLLGIAEIIDDIAIDAPKAFEFFALMVKGASLDDDRKAKLAGFSEDSERLLQLMS